MNFTKGQHVFCRSRDAMTNHMDPKDRERYEHQEWLPGVITVFHEGRTLWASARLDNGHFWYGCVINLRTEDEHALLTLAT